MLRFVRLLRILKLTRYNRAARRLKNAFYIVREELTLFVGLTLILLYLAAVGIYHFEHEAQPDTFGSVFESLWWAVATLTTVGYGDVFPITIGGRIFTYVLLILGIGVISVPAGLIAAAFTSAHDREEDATNQTPLLFDR
jgi:voltage-gated potassium channel